VQGQISFGLKVSTKWQSSGYDECREYGKVMTLGRGLASPCVSPTLSGSWS
jgi:hypothetical protein